MKRRNNLLPGLILIALGAYFFARQMGWHIPLSDTLFSWPSILLIAGLLFCGQAWSNKDDGQLFSGLVMTGLGIQFHAVHTYGLWSHHWAYFTLIIGIAFLAKYFFSRRDGWVPGIILTALSILSLFYQGTVVLIRESLGSFAQYWPVLLILAGVYILFFRKK
ncbi:LiaI-LiaF-like domain-containing protein [Alteribacter keqinensis]|uniref:LiaI-LiaF-like transmembrane region domain-containing protein n=1 Tax=Alteribacter keqinensis TaxID=2483800 RepID=A0A3M7TXD2_9BACI|nr:DUF5668 domain-containing protein [Alteribacter keqinensis]RNA70236.1 hypothetical protein EBO34_10005 [Alteribacter keqinensis]